jgi:cysteine desulfurase/selenocysteine lyase
MQPIRDQFPIFSNHEGGQPLAYLDSAATTQKPRSVIQRMQQFYERENANVQRGAYQLSAHASELYEGAREKVARFLGARESAEVIFTRGTTDSFNLLSQTLGEGWGERDVVVVSTLEHHSNFVPWQLLGMRRGVQIKFAPITPSAEIDIEKLIALIRQHRPRLVTLTHLSNAFGSLLDVSKVVSAAREFGALVALDCAQSVAHMPIQVQALGVDFIAFSGHKLYGPTGIGVLWGKRAILDSLPPYQGGGGMIGWVSTEGTTWAAVPNRFEAGTPPIAESVGLSAAIDFLTGIGFQQIEAHEAEIFDYAFDRLRRLEGVTLYGPALEGRPQRSIIGFSVAGVHPHDLATILDQKNVQIRAGHHCAMPALSALGLPATARLSLGVYSQQSDIDQLIEGIKDAQAIFAPASSDQR